MLGLAGSTGLALAEHLIEKGREVGAKVVIVGVQPFAFEGWARREKAIAAISTLRQEADSVLVISQGPPPWRNRSAASTCGRNSISCTSCWRKRPRRWCRCSASAA